MVMEPLNLDEKKVDVVCLKDVSCQAHNYK